MYKEKLLDSLIEMPFSAAISANVLAILSEDLKAIGFRSFPAFMLTGVPGSGKTAISRACLYNRKLEFSFHYHGKVSEIQNKISHSTGNLVLLDDFAQFRSIYQRDKAARYIDTVVRDSFNGDSGLLLITAENAVLDSISPSCIDRMFLLPVVNLWDDEKLVNTLNFLQNTCALQEFIDDFKMWYSKQNNQQDNMRQLLNQYRENTTIGSMRTKNIVFAYHISINYINRYLQERHNLLLPQEKIEDNCKYLFNLRWTQSENANNLLNILIDRVFSEEMLKICKPHLYEVCARYCNINCINASDRCYMNSAFCSHDYGSEFDQYYLPQDILLPNELNSALLIEHPDRIFQFPRHISNGPILIIRDNIFLSFINSVLEEYCHENSVHIQRFSIKKLHRSLYEQNLCFYRC